MLEPGKVYKVAFDVGWTSQVFNRGHRIRVTVASTGAPFYEPNPNTGEPLTIEPPEKTVVAKNTVHHDRPLCLADHRAGPSGGILRRGSRRIERGLEELNDRLAKLRTAGKTGATTSPTRRCSPRASPGRCATTTTLRRRPTWRSWTTALERGRSGSRPSRPASSPGPRGRASVVRGFVSAVDGSVQPYGVIVPAKYDPEQADAARRGAARQQPAGRA